MNPIQRHRALPSSRALLIVLLAGTGWLLTGQAADAPISEGIPTVTVQQPEPVVAPNLDLKEVAPVPQPAPVLEAFEESPAKPPMQQADPEPGTDEDSMEKFIMLGAEVAPGTATRLAWSSDGSISGLNTPTPVLVVRGARPGKTLCLTAAVHGDEINGIEIVRRVLYDIKPEKLNGAIIGIPIVNLQGFQRGSRYLPDRRDLNRFFPGEASGSLASRIAWSLFNEVISHCDLLIDMHTGSLRRTNMPQIRADMRDPDVADFTEGFGNIAVIHSAGSPGMLRYAAVMHGIPAATLEVGESLRVQEDQIDMGVSSVNRVLEREGMYSRLFSWGEPEPVYYQSSWIRAERGGILFSEKELGDRVQVDDVLGTITDPITNESTAIRSNAEGLIIGMAVDQFVMPGYGCYHIGIDTSEAVLIDQVSDETTAVDVE